MWLVESKFEGSKESVRKLLKPNSRYEVGRKLPAKLILNDKTVSQEAGYIEVGKWSQSQSDLQDQNCNIEWPKIILHAGKKLVRIIPKEDEEQWKANPEGFIGEEVQANRERELEDGDLIIFTRSSPPIRIVLEPFLFWITPNILSFDELRERQKSLALLGIPIIESPNLVKGASHLITRSAIPNVQLLEALVAEAFVVTTGYLDELIESDSLEQEYTLPNPEEYFPSENDVDDITYEEIKSKSIPDERRKTLLKGMTILCATADDETRRLFKENMHTFQAAGAYTEVCPSSSLSRFTSKNEVIQFLETKLEEARDRFQSSTQRTVDTDSINLILTTSAEDIETNWYTWFASASRKLNIFMPQDGLRALQNTILMVAPSRFLTKLAPEQDEDEEETNDVDLIEEAEGGASESGRANEEVSVHAQSGLQDARPAEPSQAPDPPHAGHGELQHAPPSPPTNQKSQAQFAVPPTPSRRPKRRAGIEKTNPFEDLFGSFSGPPPASQRDAGTSAMADGSQYSSVPPTQQSPSQSASSKPRKNLPNNREHSRRSDIWQSIFEESPLPASSAASSNTHSFGSKERYSKRFRQELEEEERQATQRSQTRTQVQTQDGDTTVRPQKNKRRAEAEAEDERGDDGAEETHAQLTAKRSNNSHARQTVSSTQNMDLISERPANTSDELAKDDRFLQSLTSLKKSKKHEDALDKEFDKLRIIKPQYSQKGGKGKSNQGESSILVREDEIDDPDFLAWQRMSVDDFNIGAAGNFIQVDFVPLIRTDKVITEEVVSVNPTQASWQNRPNFKKFRSKERPNRKTLAMALTEPNDFGIGSRYIAESSIAANSHSRSQRLGTQGRSNIAPSQKRSIFETSAVDNGNGKTYEEEEVELGSTMQIREGKKATQSKQAQNQRSSTKISPRKKQTIDLDLDLDDHREVIEDNDVFFEDSNETQSRSNSNRRAEGTGRKNHSQSKMTTFLTPAKRSHRKSVLQENKDADIDDEDEDGGDEGFTFKGFKRTRF